MKFLNLQEFSWLQKSWQMWDTDVATNRILATSRNSTPFPEVFAFQGPLILKYSEK